MPISIRAPGVQSYRCLTRRQASLAWCTQKPSALYWSTWGVTPRSHIIVIYDDKSGAFSAAHMVDAPGRWGKHYGVLNGGLRAADKTGLTLSKYWSLYALGRKTATIPRRLLRTVVDMERAGAAAQDASRLVIDVETRVTLAKPNP